MGRARKKRKTDEVYVVELITKARVVPLDSDDEGNTVKKAKGKQKRCNAKWEYYVKWAGYGSDSDSWEPQENLSSCSRLLTSFWGHLPTDDDDYLPGYVVEADPAWIEKEKQFFAKELKIEASQMNKGGEKSKTKTQKSKTTMSEGPKRKKKEEKKVKAEESSDDDRPLAYDLPPPKPGHTRKKPAAATSGKRKRKLVIESDEGESDDVRKVSNKTSAQQAGPSNTTPPAQDQPSAELDLFDMPAAELSPLFSASSKSPSPEQKDHAPEPPTPTLPAPNVPPSKPAATNVSSARKPPPLPSRLTHANKPSITIPHKKPVASTTTAPTTSATSGLSTRQRVGMTALNPMQPKEALSKAGPAPLPTRTVSDNLQNLSFKKTAAPGTHTQGQTDPQPSSRAVEPAKNSPVVNSSVTRTPIPSSAVPSSFSAPPPASAPKDPSILEAEAFLQGFMDPMMSGPLIPKPGSTNELAPPRPLHKASLPIERIPKRYKWEGALAFQTSSPSTSESTTSSIPNSSTNVVCQAKMAETTSATGLKLAIAMAGIETIVISDVYDIMDICSMLPIFRPHTHAAALVAQESSDQDAFRTLYKYFLKNLKAFLVPIIMDGTTIGQILFCPLDVLGHIISIPSDSLHKPDTFGVVVLPYALSPRQLEVTSSGSVDPFPYQLHQSYSKEIDQLRWKSTLKKAPLCQLGLRILRFPAPLFKWLSSKSERSCTIFPEIAYSPEQDLQTQLLMAVVHQTPTPLIHIRADARLVFIHNSALRRLCSLPNLVERKLQSHPWQVHFFTYGTTGNTIPPMVEVFPCGGVVTFSALAIYRNPLETCRRIEQITKHPMWTCYITPEVLGVVAKLVFGKADPLAELDKPNFPLQPILRRIEDGDIAFIHSPPDDESRSTEWLRRFLSATPPSKKRALTMAVHDYLSIYKGVSTHVDMLKILEGHMLADMLNMQRQRKILTSYRRFVILTSESERKGSGNGVELCSVNQFDFRDAFFPRQEIGK